jgi:hypothetical protein
MESFEVFGPDKYRWSGGMFGRDGMTNECCVSFTAPRHDDPPKGSRKRLDASLYRGGENILLADGDRSKRQVTDRVQIQENFILIMYTNKAREMIVIAAF